MKEKKGLLQKKEKDFVKNILEKRYEKRIDKFEKEMKTMIDLSPNLMDEEIEYDGYHSKFLLVSDLTEELEQTIRLQQGIRKTISTQLKMFGLFIH